MKINNSSLVVNNTPNSNLEMNNTYIDIDLAVLTFVQFTCPALLILFLLCLYQIMPPCNNNYEDSELSGDIYDSAEEY